MKTPPAKATARLAKPRIMYAIEATLGWACFAAKKRAFINAPHYGPEKRPVPVAIIPLSPSTPPPSPAQLRAVQKLMTMDEAELFNAVGSAVCSEALLSAQKEFKISRAVLRALGLLPSPPHGQRRWKT